MSLTMQQKLEAVRVKIASCIALANSRYNITMPTIQIRFDLTGRAAGMAGCQIDRYTRKAVPGSMYLRFNTSHMQLGGKSWDHLINETVPHEVAHSVCQAFPQFGKNHDNGWKRVCLALGGNGQRCYSEEDAPEAVAKQRPFRYISTTGHTISVSPIIHRKIQAGTTYRYRGAMGNLTKQCAFNTAEGGIIVRPAPVVAAPQTFVRSPADSGASKADRLRAYLGQAKRSVGNAAEEQTVNWAVETLGMTRALAKAYVKNNWNKV
jgi:predicted SprT family Zn-dependent metalloprotease